MSADALRKHQRPWAPDGLPLLWAAGLQGVGGLVVNETRPNLASAAPQAARNQSETPSLFRALLTLQSASGTTAFLTTLRSWRMRERGDSQLFSFLIHHLNFYVGLKVIILHGGKCVNIWTKLVFIDITQTVSLLNCQFELFYNHLIFTPLSGDIEADWCCKRLRLIAHWHNSFP